MENTDAIRKAPPRTILEVFKSLPEGTLCQVVNNQLIMSPAPHPAHQRVSRSLFRQLDRFVEAHQLGEVFYAPVDVYFDDENVYEPDIFFIATERLSIIKDNVYGAPDLIVEVLSPGSEKIDKVKKKKVYERYGVKEYWVVHPVTKKVIGYRLSGHGFVEIPSKDGVIVSSLLRVTIEF